MRQRIRGITLLETVLYIGMFMVALPTMVGFVLQLSRHDLQFDARVRMEQTASLVLSEIQNTVTSADAVRTSLSTLGTNPSLLTLTNSTGQTVVIDCPTTTAETSGGETVDIRRLRLQIGVEPAVWLTDSDIDVTTWRISPVRDSANALTGLRLEFDTAMLAANDSSRSTAFTGDTTISLSPHTVEN